MQPRWFKLSTVPPGGFLGLAKGSTVLTGWHIGRHGVDWVGTYWQAADGSHSVDLARMKKGSIWQKVATVIGQTYQVSFDEAGNPSGGPATKVLVVRALGSPANVDPFTVTTQTLNNMGWVRMTYTFTAHSAFTRLLFRAKDSPNSPFGPAIDNVSIISVPEPATWAMMLAGFGGLGAVMRRSRRKLAPIAV